MNKISKKILTIIAVLLISNSLININIYAASDKEYDCWNQLKDMPTARSATTSAVVDNKIYVIGGFSSSNVYLNTVEVYDPITDTWSTKKAMPTARSGLTSATVNGKIYVIGGYSSAKGLINTVEVYDPITDTWTTKKSMPTARHSITSAVVNDKIYVMGGYNSGILTTVQMYDTTTDTWTTKKAMPVAKRYITSLTFDNKIYVMGGTTNSGVVSTVEVYNQSTNTWESKKSMPTARRYLTSGIIGNKIYALGGYDANGDPLDVVEAYNPSTNSWESRTNMANKISSAASITLDDKIYTLGGFGTSTLKTAYEYSIDKYCQVKKDVKKAETSNDLSDISHARDSVNKIDESLLKDQLQNRLNILIPSLGTPRPKVDSNIFDIYIKPLNTVSLSLNTNSITFNNFSATENLALTNAINLTIGSSLPYQINAYLIKEFKNNSQNQTIDNNILHIKEGSQNKYLNFETANKKLTFKDNCLAGDNISHNIDLMLKTDKAIDSDTYHGTIKLEIEQK